MACARVGIALVPSDAADWQSWWATGDTAPLATASIGRAAAAWQLWLAQYITKSGDVARGRQAIAQFNARRVDILLPATGTNRP